VIIRPAKRILGSISVTGDKSISHRAAMIAAIANGTSQLRNYSTSADCAATLSCLEKLGVQIERNSRDIMVHGVGLYGLSAPNGELDCGNSGTTMRLLSGILAGQGFVSTLTGDDSLRSRPMQRIIEPLEMMGAKITSLHGRAPLRIERPQPLQAVDYELLTASAQVKSCILLAGLHAEGKTTVVENEITRDHTERMLQWFGAQIETGEPEREPENARFAAVKGPARLVARDISIPGDISSAAYFIAAAALLKDSSLQIEGVGLNPTRTAFLEIFAAMNFIELHNVRQDANEPAGVIQVSGAADYPLLRELDSPLVIDGSAIPKLIDELPLLAVVGSQFAHGIEIRDAKELRVKESDRIAATVAGLRAMGCEVEEYDDGLRVEGTAKLHGARIESCGDHRIAMSFAIAALLAKDETEIVGSECVAVSFPEFFDLLESVSEARP
jgi:3-phosphoshikimate 1-carboxyvinyltransferase